MSQIMVYKSDADGKLFEDKTKYQLHLRKLARVRQQERKMAVVESQRVDFIKKMGQVSSFHELELFVKNNWSWFYHNGLKQQWGKYNPPKQAHELANFTISSSHWKDHMSNSHRCPIGGVTNWGRYDVGNPTGYPGWYCRIELGIITAKYKYRKASYWEDGFGGDYFKGTPMATGTGGGGGHTDTGVCTYGYDMEIWAADFPVMFEQRMKERWVERENNRRAREWRYLGGNGSVPAISEIPDDWVCPDPMIEYSSY